MLHSLLAVTCHMAAASFKNLVLYVQQNVLLYVCSHFCLAERKFRFVYDYEVTASASHVDHENILKKWSRYTVRIPCGRPSRYHSSRTAERCCRPKTRAAESCHEPTITVNRYYRPSIPADWPVITTGAVTG